MDVPTRAITAGPKFHLFGYYDKLQFNPTDRYVLGMEVDFEGRQPERNDEVALGTIDIEDGDRWERVGSTTAWCWQQGCMLPVDPGLRERDHPERAERRRIWLSDLQRRHEGEPLASGGDLYGLAGREVRHRDGLSPHRSHASRLRLLRNP